jgi:hypothetical protein
MTSIVGMRYGRLVFSLFASVLSASATFADGPETISQSKIREATFEVVAAKPEKDPFVALLVNLDKTSKLRKETFAA